MIKKPTPERPKPEKSTQERLKPQRLIPERPKPEEPTQERLKPQKLVREGPTPGKITSEKIALKNITHVTKILAGGAVQMLYPLRCPVCDKIVPLGQEQVCNDCLPKLKLLTPPWCMKCGKQLAEEAEYCAGCREGKHGFVRGRALYEYNSAAQSIYRFKYSGRREYARFYGEQAVEYLGDYIRGIQPDGLVPIPLHPKRKAKRGYNQADVLAREIGRLMGLPVYSDLLVRVRNTVPLKKLNPQERQNNLKKAFNISGNDVKLNTILLIDDIYTTGSTMDEAVRVLKLGGVERVCFLTLACGTGI